MQIWKNNSLLCPSNWRTTCANILKAYLYNILLTKRVTKVQLNLKINKKTLDAMCVESLLYQKWQSINIMHNSTNAKLKRYITLLAIYYNTYFFTCTYIQKCMQLHFLEYSLDCVTKELAKMNVLQSNISGKCN